MMYTVIYTGLLMWASNGEDSELLGIVVENRVKIVAEYIGNEIGGERVTVRYWTSSVPLTREQLEQHTAEVALGVATAQYNMQYSDITGYLWTDEKMRVGGHDLIAELKNAIGMYLYMEVEVHD
jgi:Flp pilus assembly secretin CpaC